MAITLDNARYLNLQTFRKNGNAVNTPVWFAEDQGQYYLFSANNAGKVKRLRNSSQAKIAPCDLRGGLLGEWQNAQAYIVDSPEERKRAFRLLRQKYGWQVWIADFFSTLSGRIKQRTVIRIEKESTS